MLMEAWLPAEYGTTKKVRKVPPCSAVKTEASRCQLKLHVIPGLMPMTAFMLPIPCSLNITPIASDAKSTPETRTHDDHQIMALMAVPAHRKWRRKGKRVSHIMNYREKRETISAIMTSTTPQ